MTDEYLIEEVKTLGATLEELYNRVRDDYYDLSNLLLGCMLIYDDFEEKIIKEEVEG